MAASMGGFGLRRALKLNHVIGLFTPKYHFKPVKNHRITCLVTREYARGVRRTPVKVIKAEELLDMPEAYNTRESTRGPQRRSLRHDQPPSRNPDRRDKQSKSSIKSSSTTKSAKNQSERHQSEPCDGDSSDHVELEDEDSAASSDQSKHRIKYDRAYADDKRLGKVMSLLKSRKTREETGKLILEGKRLLTDALQSGAKAETIFFSKIDNLKELPLHLTDAKLVKVPFKDINVWSDLVTPYGVIGIFKQPRHDHPVDPARDMAPLPLTLICDNIRDPGNMGTILRSAVAAHCDKILVTKGCVDIWESKVLRAGAGAHFHAPILNNLTWNDITNFVNEAETTFHIADNNIQGPHKTEDVPMTSNEAPEVKADIDIAMDIARTYLPQIESKVYYDIDWKLQSALVIGGETHGLSLQALELCENTYGYKVNIPMSQSIESLNNAMSASIILFEAQRQVLEARKSKASSGTS